MTTRARLLDRLIAWSPLMLLASFAALTYWLNAQILVGAPKYDGTGRHDPDLFIENVHAVGLDEKGRIRQALTASRALHFPDDDTTHFDTPLITFNDPERPKLTITADHAIVTGDREHAYFSGSVKGVREASATEPGDGPVVLTSEYLHVIPKEDRVVTDKAVTITDPRGIINSVGMEFDNRTKKVKFASRVSGQIQPKK